MVGYGEMVRTGLFRHVCEAFAICEHVDQRRLSNIGPAK